MKLRQPVWMIWMFAACFCFPDLLAAQGAAFREGYVITKYDDTLRGLIANNSKNEIRFRDNLGHHRTFVPDELNGYMRCGMEYFSSAVPGDTSVIFIARLQHGAIDLYGTIRPEGNPGTNWGFFLGGIIGGAMASAADNGASSTGAGLHQGDCEKEYYSVGAFYLRKGSGDPLKKVPNGRNKFSQLMIPLMQDHLEVVRNIPETLFFTGNTISIVRQYNDASGKRDK